MHILLEQTMMIILDSPARQLRIVKGSEATGLTESRATGLEKGEPTKQFTMMVEQKVLQLWWE